MGILCAYPPFSKPQKHLLVPIFLTFYYLLMFKCFPVLQSLVEGQWKELVVGKLKSMKLGNSEC